MRQAAYSSLGDRIIGQGEKVELFEQKLEKLLRVKNLLTTNSATSALEIAYHLLDLKPGDEVITPVFTCTATNIPLVRHGVKIVFADVDKRMLLDWKDVRKKLNKKTRAIINVHLFEQYNRAPTNLPVPVISDAAQFLAKTDDELFTIYSFQATKSITTVDGGALVCKNLKDYKKAKLMRWYGIDREKERNIDSDILYPGFKYHMNNVAAAIGLAALENFQQIRRIIFVLQKHYFDGLKNINGVTPIGGSPFLIHTTKRKRLIDKLKESGIESGIVHKRNDIYSIFGGEKQNLPNMNKFEKTYLLLPCRPGLTTNDIDFICERIRSVKL